MSGRLRSRTISSGLSAAAISIPAEPLSASSTRAKLSLSARRTTRRICSSSSITRALTRDISKSKLNLRTKLHHSVWRQPEKFGGRSGIARHYDEQFFPPPGQVRAPAWKQPFMTEIVAGGRGHELEALRCGERQNCRNVGRFHKSISGCNAEEPVFEGFQAHAVDVVYGR